MAEQAPAFDREQLVARLQACQEPAECERFLSEAVAAGGAWDTAERLKTESDKLRYQDSDAAFRWCALMERLGGMAADSTVVALAKMTSALLHYDRARYDVAMQAFDRASELFLQAGHEMGWARTQIGRLVACMALNRFDEALQRAQQARVILERHEDAARVASLDNNTALLYERLNQPTEAIAHSERAVSYFATSGQSYLAASALSNHALMLWRLGRVREALATHDHARDCYRALGAEADMAKEETNRGGILLALGNYAEATATLSTARWKLQSIGWAYHAARAGILLVECYVRMGRYRDAIAAAEGLDAELAPFDALADRVPAAIWLALAYAGIERESEGVAALAPITGLLQERDDLSGLRAVVDLTRAQLLGGMNRQAEAGALLDRVAPALARAGLAIEAATAQTLRGSLLLEMGRDGEALQASAEALHTAGAEGLDWLAARALHVRGRVETLRGDLPRARDTFSLALGRLDRVHRRTAWDDRAAFAATVSGVYEDAVSLALRRGAVGHALYYVDKAKARALADHIQGGIDVRPRARDARSAALIEEMQALRERQAWLDAQHMGMASSGRHLRAAAPLPRSESSTLERRLAEIWRELQASNPVYGNEAAALGLAPGDGQHENDAVHDLLAGVSAICRDENAALLQYFAAGDDLVLLIVRRDGLQHLRLAGAVPVVQRLVSLLRLNVARSATAAARQDRLIAGLARNAEGILRQLYDVLLRPARALLAGVNSLIVVPHGASHHVPFHALHDGEHYLIEEYEVSYVPSAGLLAHFAARNRQIQRPAGTTARGLVLACSLGSGLAYLSREGGWVAATLGAALLQDGEATRAALESRAGSADIVHLAAHGAFDPEEPMLSWIQLGDGRLSTIDVFNLELRCSLVTLSACETALGVSGAGDELMGLSRAFLYAGTPSLVLSLWKVEDQATAALMREFYTALRAGRGKAAALRQAQLALLHGDAEAGTGSGNPFFWAPFQLIGHTGTV